MGENIIELNGKRYDAITGAFLGKSRAKPVPAAKSPAHREHAKGQVIDGFIRRQPPPVAKPDAVKSPAKSKLVNKLIPPAEPIKPVPAAKLHHAGHTHSESAPKPGVSLAAHQPQRAITLMRGAVRKPHFEKKKAIKPQAPAEIMAKPASALARKRSVAQVDPGRLERAKHISKHTSVRRFLPVAARSGMVEPTHRIAGGHVPVITVRPAPPVQHLAAQPAPVRRPDMFEAAMARARSHEQPPVKRRSAHRRMVNALAGVAVFAIIGGFIAYLNLPNIELHVASMQAGFQATMPQYRPLGYALTGSIQHDGGTVSMRFSSGDSAYIITQQSTDWDSHALLDNMLALDGAHQTIQKNGRTIYIYNSGSSAAWVAGNIRYDITGSASLSTNDIVHIASSM